MSAMCGIGMGCNGALAYLFWTAGNHTSGFLFTCLTLGWVCATAGWLRWVSDE